MDNGDSLKKTVVLCAGAGGIGHVGPMAELAEAFLNHGYDATVVLIEPPIASSDSDSTFIDRIAASHPSIPFHVLPPLPPPDFANSDEHPFLLVVDLLRRYNEPLESFLRSIVPRARLHALVVDQFYVQAIDVGGTLDVPVYTFVSSGASVLAALIQIPAMVAGRETGLKELGDTPLELVGVPPMPASHLVKDLLEHPEEAMCRALADILTRSMGTHGVLVNTFESLESRAVQALRDPLSSRLSVAIGQIVLPPIYCVGPLIGKGSSAKDYRHGEATEAERHLRHECLTWLDAQPERSVVFLCFGSMGALPETQLREIAVGLERSNHRFLWVVRTPAGRADLKKLLERRGEPDLDALLPEGFMERTKGRGLVVKSWAPQPEVLRHCATGAFVTHCGWNSALEGVAAGTPMLCWPLYAEQMMNKVLMTEDDGGMGVGVEMEGYAAGFVGAGEVEAKVRWVMDAERSRELRARVAARKREAEAALMIGGSSQVSLVQFLSDVETIREHLGK
ncbi:hypothetical protein HU200_003008 [Digitaria exilis]|uniref:Glycosyltransferase n=1 Tax=Digitaria exilis TaxID=1010633 RepID=A0A835FW02_9POAL|nr:hypothetical protein HU200_003008 [Digitaria exilis]